MTELTVSVIIPAYQSSGTIARALDSVMAQTRPAEEVVVVDDGSTDAIVTALTPFRGRVTLIRKPNGGAASARNLGIERSSGSVLAFLDADDYWEPHAIEHRLDVLGRHPEVGLVASCYYTELPGCPRKPWSPQRDLTGFGDVPTDRVLRTRGMETFRMALRAWTSTVAVRREALGGHRFAGKFEPAEDRDLWIRVLGSWPSYLASELLATAVLVSGSMSRSNVDRDFGNMLRVVREHAHLVGRKDSRRWEARFYRLWAACHLGDGRIKEALAPAWRRWRLQPFSPEGGYILLRCLAGTQASPSTAGREGASGSRAAYDDATMNRGI